MMNSAAKVVSAFANVYAVPYGIVTGRACTGLWLYLKASGTEGREAIIPANICPVVPATMLLAGMRLRFHDVDQFGLLDLDALENIDAPSGSVLLAAHLYGNILNMQRLGSIARKREWIVIEDIAQAFGGGQKGQPVGFGSNALMLSFGVGKHMDLEAGGLFLVRDQSLNREMQRLSSTLPIADTRHAGALAAHFNQCMKGAIAKVWVESETHEVKKTLLFMLSGSDSYFAGVIEALGKLDAIRAERTAKVQAIADGLSDSFVTTAPVTEGACYWRFNLLVSHGRDALLSFLRTRGIHASSYFPECAFQFPRENREKFPFAEKMGNEILNIWIGRQVSILDAERIGTTIAGYCNMNAH